MNSTTNAAKSAPVNTNPTKWTADHIGRARCYFYDADTGEELFSGFDVGRQEGGLLNGYRYDGTHLGVYVVDVRTMIHHTVTAESFPSRRVIVKFWHPEMRANDWILLVDRAKGWKGNEAGRTQIGERRADVMRYVRAMPRLAA